MLWLQLKNFDFFHFFSEFSSPIFFSLCIFSFLKFISLLLNFFLIKIETKKFKKKDDGRQKTVEDRRWR